MDGPVNAHDLKEVEDIAGFTNRMLLALTTVPGITGVTVLGSCADGRCDEFSDLDLHATTSDIDLTRSRLYLALSRTETIELEWTIQDSPGEWAATFVFRHLSPLRRLDLSIASSPKERPAGNRKLSDSLPGVDRSAGTASSAYRPLTGSIEHYTISQLLGTTRYAKARRRGHLLSCWRFASALVDAVIATGYSGIAGKSWILAGLTTLEYRDADLQLDPFQRSALISELDFSDPESMDRTVARLVDRLIANYRRLEPPMPIPDRLLRRLSGCTLELVEETWGT